MTEPGTTTPQETAPAQAAAQPDAEAKSRLRFAWTARNRLYAALAALIVGLSILWLFTEDVNPRTDDAQVDGDAIVISPRVPGSVSYTHLTLPTILLV